jgi:hypothetical protein
MGFKVFNFDLLRCHMHAGIHPCRTAGNKHCRKRHHYECYVVLSVSGGGSKYEKARQCFWHRIGPTNMQTLVYLGLSGTY